MINLINNEIDKEVLIQSLKYLPDFLQDKAIMKDAAKLLDACLSQEEDVLKQIYEAYYDTLYKIAGYQQLSYGAKVALLKEKGFDYLLNLLKHIYEEKYNQLDLEDRKKITLEQFLEQETSTNLANITMLFNLLYILKGKTLGLELALQLVNCPEFIYITWDTVANYKGNWESFETLPLPGGEIEVNKGDCYTVPLGITTTDVIFNGVSWHNCTSYKKYLTPRQPFTAELTIWGMASSSLQGKIAEFVRYYMLPYIEVTLEFTDKVDPVYCFPSGDRSLLRSYFLSYYYENGKLVQHELEHRVSQDSWKETQKDTIITMGQPIFNKLGFQGTVDLNKSFVLSDGQKHYLYGETKTIPDFITGPALDSLTPEGTITFDNDYVQAPLRRDYVMVDIVTGDQQNPHYVGDELERDTIVKYNTCLLVEGIHHAKTIQQMGELTIYDFNKDLEDTEVYAGRVTDVILTTPAERILFKKTTPEVREKTGKEPTIHLQFCDAYAQDYTGIGDLGILGSNTYFIFNNMLFINENGGITQIGEEDTWTDIGASHAVSTTYFTPGVNNGKLVYLKEKQIKPITRNRQQHEGYTHDAPVIKLDTPVVETLTPEQLANAIIIDKYTYKDVTYWNNIEKDKWTAVTGYINEYYSGFAICDGYLYRIGLYEDKIQYGIADAEKGWEYITGALYHGTYEGYGIKNGVLYTLGQVITPVMYNNQILTGWDSSFDCISRYHHNNEQYITYGICQGKLYSLQNDKVTLLDNGPWTAVCGFYNDQSPRTFAYAIKNNILYELQGNKIVLKDEHHQWEKISGCTTTTNTFVLGLANENLYKINAKTLELLDQGGWSDVFGRYTTSTSKSANCFGYGVKDRRLVVLNKDNTVTASGMWKENGTGKGVNLHDYNIEDIAVRYGSTYIEGIENVRTSIPFENEPESDYDIYVTYETIGFENNTRYNIKTEMSDLYDTYISPEDCRLDVDMSNSPEFDIKTGHIKNFTVCPLIIHGEPNITGIGDAHNFSKDNYLELPKYYREIQQEFETIWELIPYENVKLHIKTFVTESMQPIVLDETNQTGIFYGYNKDLLRSGIFVKSNNNGIETWTKALSINQNEEADFIIDFNKVNQNYEILINGTKINVPGIVNSPLYLGGNGTVYGNANILLLDSSLTVDKFVPLYENGKYFSVNTLQQDLVERIITPDKQECQKVIEIQDENKQRIIDLEMDSMYVSRKNTCSTDRLTITDNYCYDKLHYGEIEGITTSTLIYGGEFTLDPTKAKDVGNIKYRSDYGKDAIADHFTVNDYIEINPENEDPLVIITSSYVDNQILFQTDEDVAYTNKYLLTSDVTLSHSRAAAHSVPSGIIFDLETRQPGTVSRSLLYNADSFQIDPNLIFNTDDFIFDTQKAILSGFSTNFTNSQQDPEHYDAACTIPLNLDLQKEENNTKYFNILPILKVHVKDTMKQKIAQIAFKDIIIGNKEIKYFDQDGNEVPKPITPELPENPDETILPNLFSLTQEQEQGQEPTEPTEPLPDGEKEPDTEVDPEGPTDPDPEIPQEPIITEKVVIDPDSYPYLEETDYYLKFEMTRKDLGIIGLDKHESISPEPKDKFRNDKGKYSNFSAQNYFVPTNLTDTYGIQLCYIADDDVSKDQGLFGVPNGQSICIKDNKLTLCDKMGNVQEVSQEVLADHDTFFILLKSDPTIEEQPDGTIIKTPNKLKDARVYVLDPEEGWSQLLFENKITVTNNMWIGYANAGSGMLPFNGACDLTKSFVYNEAQEEQLFYNFTQTLTMYASPDNVDYEIAQVIETPIPDDQLLFGYEFKGHLDLYGSITTGQYGFLLPYELGWLENNIYINDIIKQAKAQLDPTYDPDLDPTVYGIEEYGIHLEDAPQRWDEVTVTYKTEDNAYYMDGHTKYFLKCEVEQDENGKCILDKTGNPSWNSAIVGQFTNNDYYSIDFTNEKYLVLHCTTKDISNQYLCSYIDNNTQGICIKDGKWQLFTDTEYKVICDAQENTDYFFKLSMLGETLKYSLDNETWVDTNITATFAGYETFTIGKGNNQPFKGNINLNDSYTITDQINYLFVLYKRVTPYISRDGYYWTSLVLEPMLTIKNMISFGQGFSGSLLLEPSNLLLDGATYWTANQVNIYALVDIPEDNIHANDLVRTVIMDDITIDTSKYWYDMEKVKIDPKDLRLIVEGKPLIADTINLTYDTWFLFRQLKHEYDFKITYKEDRASVSYVDLKTKQEFIIYEMALGHHFVNTGYNFWGTLSVKDSYRGGLRLCDYIEWITYTITYKKHNETKWQKWSEFSIESRYNINMRTGYELLGKLYMETSFVKLGNLVAPFLAYWDGTYITIAGAVKIEHGIASEFTAKDFLLMNMYNLKDGDVVAFEIEFEEMINQGIGTQLRLEDGYMCSGDEKLQKVYPGYKAYIEYHIEDGYVYARVIGRNTSNFDLPKSPERHLTIIPFNELFEEHQVGHYVKSQEDAKKLSVYYRVGDCQYDHYQTPKLDWTYVELELADHIDYFGKVLENIYVAKIPMGYMFDAAHNPINVNPHNIKYLQNEPMEYKIVNKDGLVTSNQTVLYDDKIEKQRTRF